MFVFSENLAGFVFLKKPVLRKSGNNLNPQFLCNCFNFSTLPYELRKGNKVNLREKMDFPLRDKFYIISWSFAVEQLTRNIKESHSVEQFKEKIKELGNLTFSCVFCR